MGYTPQLVSIPGRLVSGQLCDAQEEAHDTSCSEATRTRLCLWDDGLSSGDSSRAPSARFCFPHPEPEPEPEPEEKAVLFDEELGAARIQCALNGHCGESRGTHPRDALGSSCFRSDLISRCSHSLEAQ